MPMVSLMLMSSRGMVDAPAITLKSMYHTEPMNMRNTEATASPPGACIRARSTTGKSAVDGMEAMICTSGSPTRATRGLSPMARPRGSVRARAMARAVQTRARVASRPTKISYHWPAGTRTIINAAWKAP